MYLMKEENFLCLSSGSRIRSSKYIHNIPEVRLFRTRTKQWCFMTKTYLQKFLKPLKNLLRYHHFGFHADSPGRIEMKERNSGNPVSVNVLKGNEQPKAGHLPDVITERGLDIGRQWYLFESFREFCSSDAAKDAVFVQGLCFPNLRL